MIIHNKYTNIYVLGIPLLVYITERTKHMRVEVIQTRCVSILHLNHLPETLYGR